MIVYNGPFRDGHRRIYGKKSSVVFVNLNTLSKPTSARTEGKKGFPAEDL